MESSARIESALSPEASPGRAVRILISAGEASGDLHGADLAREILALHPSCEISGIAGTQMRAAGVKALYRIEEIAGLGLTELRSTIVRTVGALRQLRSLLRDTRPNLLR